MLRPLLIVFFVMLAKLHCGDGVGPPNPWERRYGSFPSRRFPSSSSPAAVAPAPAPAPASPPSPSLRTPPSFRSSRFGNAGIPQQQSSPGLTQSRSFKEDPSVGQPAPSQQSRRFGNSPSFPSQQQRPQAGSNTDAGQFLPPELLRALSQAGGGDIDFPQFGPIMPDIRPGTIMVEIGPDGRPIGPIPPGYRLQEGGPVDVADHLENQKRIEEENHPDNHKISEGETIEQQLPSGGGDIVIKISGTNITQRKMNKLRDLLKKSIDFVFENAQSKSIIKARLM